MFVISKDNYVIFTDSLLVSQTMANNVNFSFAKPVSSKTIPLVIGQSWESRQSMIELISPHWTTFTPLTHILSYSFVHINVLGGGLNLTHVSNYTFIWIPWIWVLPAASVSFMHYWLVVGRKLLIPTEASRSRGHRGKGQSSQEGERWETKRLPGFCSRMLEFWKINI